MHYAQAWRLVHLLRHGPREYRPLFGKLISELKRGATAKAAIATVFGSVDLAKMSRAVYSY